MKISDIPYFFNPPNYSVHVDWLYIEDTLASYNEKPCASWLGLNLDPDFQRGHVWSEDKQIAFVEFCLRKGQSSRQILFNHPNWQGSYDGEMVLVDGKQRLEAVRKFVRNELPIFNGNYLKDFDLSRQLLRGDGAHFIFSVNNLKTKKEILEWYLQINSGGVVHTKEELQKVKDLLDKETA